MHNLGKKSFVAVLLFGVVFGVINCKDEPHPNGCSIPWYAEVFNLFIKNNKDFNYIFGDINWGKGFFDDECIRHDHCYVNGSYTYGMSRSQCDNAFFQDMNMKCTTNTTVVNSDTVTKCLDTAGLMYNAVNLLGASHFSTDQVCKYYDKDYVTSYTSFVSPLCTSNCIPVNMCSGNRVTCRYCVGSCASTGSATDCPTPIF